MGCPPVTVVVELPWAVTMLHGRGTIHLFVCIETQVLVVF